MAAGEERRKQALLQGPIRRVQRRLNQEIWARGLVVPAWSAATALALYRFAFRAHVAWAAALLAVVGAAFWLWRTWPKRVPLAHAAALTDKSVGAGGLLLTRLEVPVGEWELSLNERVRRVELPAVPVGRPLALVLLSALFLAAALLVPLPPRPSPRVNAAAASRLAQVEAKAEALAQERPLSDEQAELARLKEELAGGRFDASDWEAADGVSHALDEKAAQAAADLSKAEAAAKALEDGLARGVSKEEEGRERDSLERALMSLGEGSGAEQGQGHEGEQGEQGQGDPSEQQAGQDGQQGKEGQQGAQGQEGQQGQDGQQGKQGQQGSKGAQAQSGQQGARSTKPRSAAEASELRRALASRQRSLAKSFGQGTGTAQGESQSGDPENGQGEGKPGSGAPHPSRMVGQGTGTGMKGDGKGKGMGGGPGPGGGHDPLVFGGDARMDPDRLEFSPLPKGQGGEAGELWGLRGADPRPDVEHARGDASGSAARGERAPGTRSGPLLPRNRELVRRYFDSK